jgi:hypothetical protein
LHPLWLWQPDWAILLVSGFPRRHRLEREEDCRRSR